ncbi:hypothetical protein [Moorena sp. SIO4A5]|uniref:hypothetical protein n=1 Tax=Moorena sp. SIO4A5 TaxID=2607838 RepID=UPI0025E560A2|nr:hypothetical protein [Moorena sp. SIO4A5]
MPNTIADVPCLPSYTHHDGLSLKYHQNFDPVGLPEAEVQRVRAISKNVTSGVTATHNHAFRCLGFFPSRFPWIL